MLFDSILMLVEEIYIYLRFLLKIYSYIISTLKANELKKKREELALTQEEIAKLTGFKSNYYAKIERGEINLTLKNVHKIINSLKLDANEIFST